MRGTFRTIGAKMAAGGLLTAMLLLSPALVQASTFNPERDAVTARKISTYSNINRPLNAEKLKIEHVEAEPSAGYSQGLHQAWRVLNKDGVPLTQWVLYPDLRYAFIANSQAGTVIVFDDAEALDDLDESKRKSAWYRCTTEKTERLPYYHIQDSDHHTTYFGFIVAFNSSGDPDVVPRGGRFFDRSGVVGWRDSPPENVKRLSIVGLNEEFLPVSKPVELDPRASPAVGIRGKLLVLSTKKGKQLLVDRNMSEVKMRASLESGSELMGLDDEGKFYWRSVSGQETAFPGPWESFDYKFDHGMARVRLHAKGAQYDALAYVGNFNRYELLTDSLIDLSFTQVSVPEAIKADNVRYAKMDTLQVALVRMGSRGNERVAAIPLGIVNREYTIDEVSANESSAALEKALGLLNETNQTFASKHAAEAAAQREREDAARKAEEAQRIVAQKEAGYEAQYRKRQSEMARQETERNWQLIRNPNADYAVRKSAIKAETDKLQQVWKTNPTRENLGKCVELAKASLNFIWGKNCARKLGGSDWYTFLEFDTTASGQDLQAAIQDARAHGNTYWINRLQQLRSRTDYNDRLDASVAAANAERQRKSDERAAAGRAFNANMKVIQDSCMRNPASCQGNSSTDWSKESENAHRASDAAIRDMNRRIDEAGR
ncbi:hypothetical protein FE236_00350 [Mariprofundus erugo]|uniref:hypothetical protein n=1 Tax=Mariprofundus erugo TaxID=2528639 RepID=UPI0010FD6FA6|nr:hypothetical protein [Mariprofundus erugo]TLS78244.1 hypothetical protein FE236_00350 [Mariprofundus erugo]